MEQKTKNEISKLLKQYNEDPLAKRLVDKYCSPLIYDDVFGICHSEVLHTNFIKWLVKQSKHKSPNTIMYNFLKAVCDKGEELLPNDSNVKSDVYYVKKILSHKNLTISIANDPQDKQEYCTYYKKNSMPKNAKVDIVIDLELKTETESIPLKIIIENKVYSPEHDSQTNIYYSYFSGDDTYFKDNTNEDLRKFKFYTRRPKAYSKKDERQLFVFLHPVDYDIEEYAENLCSHFIRFTYQDLLDKVILKSIGEFTPVEKAWIDEYVKILIRPDAIFRTMTKELEDIPKLKQFVEDYVTLFKLVNEELKESDNENIKEVSKIIENTNRKVSRSILYDLEIAGEKFESLIMRKVACEIVCYLLLKKDKPLEYFNKELNFLHKKEPWILEERQYFDKMRTSSQDKMTFERRWAKVSGSRYIENQWQKEIFDSFIDKVHSEFPEIRVVVSQNQ